MRGLRPAARRTVMHLGDGRWWDDERRAWRCGEGRMVWRRPQSHQLVQDATSILMVRSSIAVGQNRQNLVARRHADHPHRTPP